MRKYSDTDIESLETPGFFKTLLGKILSIILGAIFLVFLFNQLIMPTYTKHGKTMEMPDIAGQDTVSAKILLSDLNLVPVNEDSQYSEILSPGKILAQRPLPGARIKEGRRVYITYSKGKRPLFMPDLTTKGQRDAKIIIRQIGLKLGYTAHRYSSNIAKGTVSGQSIPPNDPFSPGDFIDITVSKGPSPDKLVVPDVVNRPLKMARRQLEMVGLPIDSILYVPTFNSIPDMVIRQSLPAGHNLRAGDKIVLTVTKNGN